MKIGKILVGGLLASSSIGNTSSTLVKVDYGSHGLAKTFEVRENINYNFVENSASKIGRTDIVVVDQKSLDSYSDIKPIKCPDAAGCAQTLFEQLAICTSMFSSFPPALAICVSAAWGAYYICMRA